MALRPCNPFNSNNYIYLTQNFIQFATQYIQDNDINDHRGWTDQLRSYNYKYSGGVADYKNGIKVRLNFHEELRNTLDNNDNQRLQSIVNKIMEWGGMKPYEKKPADIINSFKILDSLNRGDGNWRNLIGKRIASTSKIYAMYSPTLWSIYDSRVGKGIQSIVSIYEPNPNNISGYLKFQCPLGRDRGPINGFKSVSSPHQAILGFLYASWLFRSIADKLNNDNISLPEPRQNEIWSVYHIEMVFFMIGR